MADKGVMSPEQLDALGEEIATFAARIDVAKHALLTRLRQFDAHEAWGHSGFLSCAHWLSWRIGIGLTAAREHVRVARALAELPKVDALFGRGELSYSKVRAITRVATPQTEQDFVDVATHATAAQLERLVRSYQRCVDLADGAEGSEPRVDQRRFVRRCETLGGMVRIEMQLPPEEAAVVWDAMLAAAGRGGDSESSAETSAETSAAPAETSAETSPASDAFDPHQRQQERADAIVDIARAYLQQRPRTRGSGHELVVITSKDQLEHGHAGVGGFLADGTPVPLHVTRMLACDSARIDVVVGEQGELLDVGRRTRTIPAAIARGLWLRDGGCRVPGCGRKQHLHAHHVHGWARGGATSMNNLVLVCSSHHRMIHEGTLACEVGGRELVFVDSRGRSIPAVPGAGASGRELEELELFLREADLHLDPSINAPRWDGTPMNLNDSVGWMLLAHQRDQPASSSYQ